MSLQDKILLGYFLCAALGIIAGIMLTVLAYERFGEAEEAEEAEEEIDDKLLFWEEDDEIQ